MRTPREYVHETKKNGLYIPSTLSDHVVQLGNVYFQ